MRGVSPGDRSRSRWAGTAVRRGAARLPAARRSRRPGRLRLAERERAAALREYEVVVARPMRGDTGVFQLPDVPERELVCARWMHTSGKQMVMAAAALRSACSICAVPKLA